MWGEPHIAMEGALAGDQEQWVPERVRGSGGNPLYFPVTALLASTKLARTCLLTVLLQA